MSSVLMSCDAVVKNQMAQIHNIVADDAVKSYDLSVKGGDKIEICVKAGLVVAAFNQAHDESNYLSWKKIESARCTAAGLKR